MNISATDPDDSPDQDGAEHRGGHVEGSPPDGPDDGSVSRYRLAHLAELVADGMAVLALVWALWWLIDDDGGVRSVAMVQLGYLLLAATPIAVAELMRLARAARIVILALATGWLVALAFAVDRSGFVDAALVAGSAPLLFLLSARLQRRRWGPAALVAIVAVSFSAWAWEALLKWWGFVQLGAQPRWDLVSWRNQSGILSAAFGLFLLGPTLAARRSLPLFAGGLAALGLAGAWLSSSRGAIVFAAIGAAAVIGAASWWRWREAPRTWWRPAARSLAVAVAGAAIAAGLLSMLPPGTESPVSSRSEAVSGNAIQRGEHWLTAARMGASRPLVGIGPGSYRSSMPLFNGPDGRLTSAAHNEWLEAWSDGGLALALPMWSVAVAGAVLVWRRGRRPALSPTDPDEPSWMTPLQLRPGVVLGAIGVVVGVGGHAAIDFDFHYPVITAMFVMALGVLAAERGAPPAGGRDGPGRGLMANAPAVGAVAATAAVLVLGIWGATSESNARSDRLDMAESLEEISAAQAPWDTPARLYVAGLQREQGNLVGAIATLQPAIAWSPNDPRPVMERARLRYRLGQISDVELVAMLDDPPTRLREWSHTAGVLLAGGSLDLAEEVARTATDFHPRYLRWGIDETVAQAWSVRVGVALARDDCEAVRRHLAAAAAAAFDISDRGFVDGLRQSAAPDCPVAADDDSAV